MKSQVYLVYDDKRWISVNPLLRGTERTKWYSRKATQNNESRKALKAWYC